MDNETKQLSIIVTNTEDNLIARAAAIEARSKRGFVKYHAVESARLLVMADAPQAKEFAENVQPKQPTTGNDEN